MGHDWLRPTVTILTCTVVSPTMGDHVFEWTSGCGLGGSNGSRHYRRFGDDTEASQRREIGDEGACTGFATAAALNLLRQGNVPLAAPDGVSPRRLYEMAKLHDEWAGSGYEGSTVRGAIKGFFHNGVCLEREAPYVAKQTDLSLNITQAKQARQTILGAYYRLRPILVDYHAALQQAGAIVCSASIHTGWKTLKAGGIVYSTRNAGGHAFVIVGYDDQGFLIQNSWGPDWGKFNQRPGIAHWSYHDWAQNIVDAWVMRLAVSTPKAFELTHRVPRQAGTERPEANKPTPRRQDVIGQIIHLDDGKLVTTGNYGTPLASIQETAKVLHDGAGSADRKYEHLLYYAHGGVTDVVAAARRTSATRDGFKRNRIYPIHFLWETGLLEEISDIVAGKVADRGGRITGFEDASDFLIEKLSGGIGRALWREMKLDATRAFEAAAESAEAVRTLLAINQDLVKPIKIHLVGHSAGSNFVGEFLGAWHRVGLANSSVENCFTLGAACTVAQYQHDMRAALDDGRLKNLTVYNLSKERELDDTVGPYSKWLLYLVSKAFEEAPDTPLLGMDEYARQIAAHPNQTIVYTAGEGRKRTDATSHGSYGTDLTALNDILKTVLGDDYKPSQAFRAEELAGA